MYVKWLITVVYANEGHSEWLSAMKVRYEQCFYYFFYLALAQ